MTRRFPPPSALRDFLESESAGGMLLIFAAILAMIVANSPLSGLYHDLIHAVTGPVLTDKLGPMTVHLWINDGLMVIFFFVVGLEEVVATAVSVQSGRCNGLRLVRGDFLNRFGQSATPSLLRVQNSVSDRCWSGTNARVVPVRLRRL